MTDGKHDMVLAAPPIGVGALSFAGIALADWVLIATLVYTLFLIIDKLPTVARRVREMWHTWKEWRNGRN